MTLLQKQQDLTAALAAITDAQERFAWLVNKGKSQASLDPEFRSDHHLVEGCLSKLWFVPEYREGRCYFQADSESVIAKAIAGLLCDFYSGSHPREILKIDPSFLAQVGITQHLTPNRRNSLSKVWTRIHTFAADCLEQRAHDTASLMSS